MVIRSARQIAEDNKDESWYARMAALEDNWHVAMVKAQAEYQHVREQLHSLEVP